MTDDTTDNARHRIHVVRDQYGTLWACRDKRPTPVDDRATLAVDSDSVAILRAGVAAHQEGAIVLISDGALSALAVTRDRGMAEVMLAYMVSQIADDSDPTSDAGPLADGESIGLSAASPQDLLKAMGL